MKKSALLNAPLSAVIAKMGHTDTLTIGDCGLPIRGTGERIDLALTLGVPGFIETLKIVLSELHVEKIILAEEIRTVSPDMLQEILACFPENIPVEYIPHEDFKKSTECSRAIVRTGETTSYANIILVSGVVF